MVRLADARMFYQVSKFKKSFLPNSDQEAGVLSFLFVYHSKPVFWRGMPEW
jgi:hypothetical protein